MKEIVILLKMLCSIMPMIYMILDLVKENKCIALLYFKGAC